MLTHLLSRLLFFKIFFYFDNSTFQITAMNLLKLILAALFISAFFVLCTTQFTSCTKTETEFVHDTTTVVQKDTVIQKDTLIVVDSFYDLREGLIAYYNFNGGNLNDSSGYGNNIVFNNATPAPDRLGRANNAYLFNGVNSYMTVPNNASLNPTIITIMARVKFNGFNTGICHASQILMKGSQDQDGGTYGIRVIQGDGSCAAQLDTSDQKISGYFGDYGSVAGSFDPNYLARANTWVTYVYTYDGKRSCDYINGQLSYARDGSAQFHMDMTFT